MSTTTSNTSPQSLLLFTTSQIPLGIKYPHPRKPALVIPALVHRSLHSALDTSPPSAFIDNDGSHQGGRLIIPHPDSLSKFDIPSHPTSSPRNSIDDSAEGASSTVSDYELTLKLHLVGSDPSTSASAKVQWIKDSLELLERYKGFSIRSIDTLLLGFKGMDYRGNKTIASEFFGCGSEGLEAPNTESISEELEKEILEIWNTIASEDVLAENTKLGTMYSTFGLLKRLVEREQKTEGGKNSKSKSIRVNSLDTPDCHHLPKEYTQFAKENNVELWAGGGGEGSDPLPSAHLHNLLQEFIPKLDELPANPANEPNVNGNGLTKMNNLIALRDDGLKFVDDSESVKGVDVKWVLGYTLLSKTRNVVHDKGYLILADFL